MYLNLIFYFNSCGRKEDTIRTISPNTSTQMVLEEHRPTPEEILKNLPAGQVPDMSQALKSVKFDFTEEKVTALLKEVLTGYQESIKDKPEADMDKMQAALKQYLTSKEMNERLCKDLQELVKNNVNVDMSSEKLIAVAVGLMNQYQEYAKANGITQTDVASILAFLSQGEIQQQQVSRSADQAGEQVAAFFINANHVKVGLGRQGVGEPMPNNSVVVQ